VDKEIDNELTKVLHRALLPMRRSYAGHYIVDQISIAKVKSHIDETPTKVNDKRYRTNDDFWRDVISETLRANTIIEFDEFELTEWIPWSPGAFHTEQAKAARQEAWNYRRPNLDAVFPAAARKTLRAKPEVAVRSDPESNFDGVVFEPQGKLSMIQGGVGCVRLQPVELRSRREFWLMGATSSSVVHEGILVALNDDLYDKFGDDISRGGLHCEEIVGRLRFVRDLDQLVYRTGIPKLYVEVDKVKVAKKRMFMRRPAASCLVCADSGPSRTVIPMHRGQRSGDCGQLPMSV
jgi:hypothetical protein